MSMLVIAEDFSISPGSRYRHEGPNSGEEFRERILEPRFLAAQNRNEKLIIDLDGVFGYATSFLEESFGGLAKRYGAKLVLDTIEWRCQNEPSLVEEIRKYIRNA
jgi:STAS-like domain of unknown function (DUF4325)